LTSEAFAYAQKRDDWSQVSARDQLAARPHRDRTLTVIRGRIEQHMKVVLGIDRESLADRGLLIGVPRLEIRAYRVAPAANLVPRVRRHVVDVAGAGNSAFNAIANAH